jgi:hypothetical protein
LRKIAMALTPHSTAAAGALSDAAARALPAFAARAAFRAADLQHLRTGLLRFARKDG